MNQVPRVYGAISALSLDLTKQTMGTAFVFRSDSGMFSVVFSLTMPDLREISLPS